VNAAPKEAPEVNLHFADYVGGFLLETAKNTSSV
jgi:hypothetical protein